MPNHAEQLAQELNLNVKNVQGAIELIDQGNTIPFIARYRKEATGSMDDQVLRDLGDRLEYLRGLDKRKDEVTSSITEQGAMTPELTAALSKAKTLAEVEDIYRPYKPKRKTRASIAKARGLQPLATAIFRQDAAFDPEKASESRGRFFSAHSAHRASFCALVSFFRAASRRRAADLSVHRSRYANRCAPSARVHLAPFPLLWACRRLAGSLVQPV